MGIPPDLRFGTCCLRSTTSHNRSCTWQLRSGAFLLGSTTLHSLYLSIFLYACFVKKCSTSRSFCHLHLSMLGVGRCCNRQTLFKCHKSQTECPECSKTPGRRSGTPPLVSALQTNRFAEIKKTWTSVGAYTVIFPIRNANRCDVAWIHFVGKLMIIRTFLNQTDLTLRS